MAGRKEEKIAVLLRTASLRLRPEMNIDPSPCNVLEFYQRCVSIMKEPYHENNHPDFKIIHDGYPDFSLIRMRNVNQVKIWDG
ncbi:MAG: hypothetical protein WCK34_09200 [Bacteroidota bacterium]